MDDFNDVDNVKSFENHRSDFANNLTLCNIPNKKKRQLKIENENSSFRVKLSNKTDCAKNHKCVKDETECKKKFQSQNTSLKCLEQRQVLLKMLSSTI